MAKSTITYDNYKFVFELVGSQLNINLTDTDLLNQYTTIIKEADIYVKPIKKFHSMIEKALEREPNYIITISEKKGQLVFNFAYNHDIFEVEEEITFTKVNGPATKELLLIERVKELTELTTPIFGYRGFGEKMMFDLDSKILDFRQFDDYIMSSNINLMDFDKFKKVKKIIITTDSKIFCGVCNTPVEKMGLSCGCKISSDGKIKVKSFIGLLVNPVIMNESSIAKNIIEERKFAFQRPKSNVICPRHSVSAYEMIEYISTPNCFNNLSVYMPSVTEVEVFCNQDYIYYNLESDFTKFGSLPNLEKLTLYCNHIDPSYVNSINVHSIISTSPNKKLKHIIFKNFGPMIILKSIEEAKIFARINHIRLEII